MDRAKILQVILGLCAFAGVAFGATKYLATAEQLASTRETLIKEIQANKEYLQLVDVRLGLKINSDKIYDIQKRIDRLEDKNGGPDCSRWTDMGDRERYRSLKATLKELEEERQLLFKKHKGR